MPGQLARVLLVVLPFASAATSSDRDAPSEMARDSTLLPLRLVWFDPEAALPGGFGAVSREVATLFRGLGVEVSWRMTRPGDKEEGMASDEVAVILLPSNPQGRAAAPGVMGAVQRSQEPPRSAWVFVSEVRRALCLPNGICQLGYLPMAVARVVAHEVVHAIIPVEPHAKGGLMNHALDRADLVGRRPAVSPGCARALLGELADPDVAVAGQ